MLFRGRLLSLKVSSSPPRLGTVPRPYELVLDGPSTTPRASNVQHQGYKITSVIPLPLGLHYAADAIFVHWVKERRLPIKAPC